MGERAAVMLDRADEELVEVEVDIEVGTMDSPVGGLVLAATDAGLVTISFGEEDRTVEELARRLSPRVVHRGTRLERVRRELDEYFEGRRTLFEVPVDLRLARGFGRAVLEAATAVPYGQLTTYAEVAAAAGNPHAARAAGNALGANPIPIVVPCHRVVRSGGGFGGYTGGRHVKERLLQLEGALLT